jgi:hypothetical protein
MMNMIYQFPPNKAIQVDTFGATDLYVRHKRDSMTLRPTGKCANAVVREIQDYLTAFGYVKIAKGVSAKALDDIVHAYEIQRIGQTEYVQLRYGVNVYNTVCQHLHDYLDSGSLTFKLPGMGRDSARVVDCIKECIKSRKRIRKFPECEVATGEQCRFLG